MLPENSADLISLATSMLNGMGSFSPSLTFVTAAQLSSDLDAFAATNGTYNVARSDRQTFQTNYKPAAQALYDWLLGVKNMLATHFGTRWNTQWAQAGFINPSTAIPVRTSKRMGLALLISNFLTGHPDLEVPVMNFTGSHGASLRKAVITARNNVTASEVVADDAMEQRETVGAVLRKTMQAVLANLFNVLSKSDPRWVNFGLPIPSANRTPGQPLNLSAMLDENGQMMVQCDAVPLATRYRFRMLLVGVQPDYALAGSSKEPLATIKKMVEPGNTVQIIAQAVNGNLQGQASEPVLLAIPVAVKSVAVAEVPASTLPPATLPPIALPVMTRGSESTGVTGLPATNGYRNGNGVHVEAA